jgi:hypothetical protein
MTNALARANDGMLVLRLVLDTFHPYITLSVQDFN